MLNEYQGSIVFWVSSLIERLSTETLSAHLRFTSLVILSDSKSLHLAMYTYGIVIVGRTPSLSRAVGLLGVGYFHSGFSSILGDTLEARILFSCRLCQGHHFLIYHRPAGGRPLGWLLPCAGGQQRPCPSTWACFVKRVKYKVPGMYPAFDKI